FPTRRSPVLLRFRDDGERGARGDGGDAVGYAGSHESPWRIEAPTMAGTGSIVSRFRAGSEAGTGHMGIDFGNVVQGCEAWPMSSEIPAITIPSDLLPADGRFGCGPSKIRPEAVEALAAEAGDYLGTSHRQAPVKFMVSRLRNAVAELLNLPDGYEVMLGNGGTTTFWDAL